MKNLFYLTLLCFMVTACASQPTAEPETVAQVTLQATEVVQPTETAVPTETPLPPTDTPSATATPLPPTATPTPTNTPLPPTDTPTATATPSPTDTPIPPTATPTNTPIPPTPTQSAVDHFEQATTYFEASNWEAAITELQAALTLQPDLGPAYKLLGLSYINQGDFGIGLEALGAYLQFVPEAADRAEIETQMEGLKGKVLAEEYGIEIPAGQAVFVFLNYTGNQWNVDFGPYFLEVPPKAHEEDGAIVASLPIDPGSYSWMAKSPTDGSIAAKDNGDKLFDFTVGIGKIHIACVGGSSNSTSGTPDIHTWGPFEWGVSGTPVKTIGLC